MLPFALNLTEDFDERVNLVRPILHKYSPGHIRFRSLIYNLAFQEIPKNIAARHSLDLSIGGEF